MALQDTISASQSAITTAAAAIVAAQAAALKAVNAGDTTTASAQEAIAKTNAQAIDQALTTAQLAIMNAGNAVVTTADATAVHAAATSAVSMASTAYAAMVNAMATRTSVFGANACANDSFYVNFNSNGCKLKVPTPVTNCINCVTDNKPGISLGCCFTWSLQAYQQLNAIVNAGGVVAWNSACSGRTVICGGVGPDAVTAAINVLTYLRALGYIDPH